MDKDLWMLPNGYNPSPITSFAKGFSAFADSFKITGQWESNHQPIVFPEVMNASKQAQLLRKYLLLHLHQLKHLFALKELITFYNLAKFVRWPLPEVPIFDLD